MQTPSQTAGNVIPSPVQRVFSTPEERASYDELVSEIKREIRQHRRAARWKSGASQAVVLVSIVTSTLATANASGQYGQLPGPWGMVIAAFSGVALLFARSFKYESRARWHKLKQRKLEAFYRELRFQGADPAEVSRRLSQTLERLDALRTDVGVPDQ